MRGKEAASQAGQWLDCHPPSPFGPVDVGEVEGHSAEARDLNSDNRPNGPGPGCWCGPGCGFRRNTTPPGRPRAGHPGSRGAASCARRAGQCCVGFCWRGDAPLSSQPFTVSRSVGSPASSPRLHHPEPSVPSSPASYGSRGGGSESGRKTIGRE